jgi:hypothetical protein
VGRDGAGYRSDLGQTGMKLFLQRGLDSFFAGAPVGQITALPRPHPENLTAASELKISVQSRHCEERSDEAIQLFFRCGCLDCFAALAMTALTLLAAFLVRL